MRPKSLSPTQEALRVRLARSGGCIVLTLLPDGDEWSLLPDGAKLNSATVGALIRKKVIIGNGDSLGGDSQTWRLA